MPSKGKITAAERRHRDYLRRKTLRVASVYETRLAKDRRAELRRVLSLAKDYNDPIAIVPLIQGQIDETAYLGKWWQGLVVDAGLPIAKATARDLRAMKAAGEEDVWLSGLRNYATARAGQEIRVVSGTWRDTLVRLVRQILAEDLGLGIEKVTKELYRRYLATIEKWQCRRIAQTEAMIGMAEAANDAAQTLSIHFTKQWSISGLGNTRASHELMDGVTVDEDEPFVLEGGMMMYPHDPSMGADAGEIINCACDCIRRPKGRGSDAVSSQDTSPNPVGAPTSELTEEQAREKRINELLKDYEGYPEDVQRALAENDYELERSSRTTKGSPMSIDDADKQRTNPKFKQVGEEGYTEANEQYHRNCGTCVQAYELRRRGHNVTAKGLDLTKDDSLNYLVAKNPYRPWKNADGSKPVPRLLSTFAEENNLSMIWREDYKEFLESSTKEEGRYILSLTWKDGTGHATTLERLKTGELIRVESQQYYSSKGTFRDIDELCARVGFKPGKIDGILRVDDKVFDKRYLKLFSIKKNR